MSRPVYALKRVHGLLADDQQFAVALPEARRLAELNRRFARLIPSGLAQACRVVALHGDTALVYCSHGAAAARLRSQSSSVACGLATPAVPVAGVKIKVRADWVTAPRQAKAGIGDAGLQAWRSLAEELPDNGLRSAVLRLLGHHRGDRE